MSNDKLVEFLRTWWDKVRFRIPPQAEKKPVDWTRRKAVPLDKWDGLF